MLQATLKTQEELQLYFAGTCNHGINFDDRGAKGFLAACTLAREIN